MLVPGCRNVRPLHSLTDHHFHVSTLETTAGVKVSQSPLSWRTFELQDPLSGYLTSCLVTRLRRPGQDNSFLSYHLSLDPGYWPQVLVL